MRLFVGNLNPSTSEQVLLELFEKHGRVQDCSVKRGFAFVEYAEPSNGETALKELHGADLDGRKINVEEAKRPAARRREREPRPAGYRVSIENLPSSTSWQDLKDFGRKAGDVTYADVFKDGSGRGVIEFARREDMEYALEKLDDTRFEGNYVRISKEREGNRPQRRRSRSASAEHHRRRSRSRDRDSRRYNDRNDRNDRSPRYEGDRDREHRR